MMDFMGVWMLLGLVLVALLLGGAIYLGVRAGVGPRREDRRVGRDDARSELDRRLASGEIDLDDYHERASALRSLERPARRR